MLSNSPQPWKQKPLHNFSHQSKSYLFSLTCSVGTFNPYTCSNRAIKLYYTGFFEQLDVSVRRLLLDVRKHCYAGRAQKWRRKKKKRFPGIFMFISCPTDPFSTPWLNTSHHNTHTHSTNPFVVSVFSRYENQCILHHPLLRSNAKKAEIIVFYH